MAKRDEEAGQGGDLLDAPGFHRKSTDRFSIGSVTTPQGRDNLIYSLYFTR